MTATNAVTRAAEVRRKKERRRRVGFWAALVAMLLVIATTVVVTIGFNDSWWVQAHPIASSDQKAPDGSSTFTQAGIDYLNRVGLASVTLGPDRPTAAQLGLEDSGTRHIDFLVPLTVTVTATRKVEFDDMSGIDLTTSNGRLSFVEVTPDAPYSQLTGLISTLAPTVGWSDSAVTDFQNDLVASRRANDGSRFSATIGPAAATGMRVSATLSGDQSASPTLVIHLAAAN